MKRGVFDILRRGLDNTIANWQVPLIFFLEGLAFGLIFIAAVVAILLPIGLSLGITLTDFEAPEGVAEVLQLLMTKWVLLLWVILGISVLLLVLMLVHSFVEAGCVRVLVEGERVAGPAITGPRSRYRAFSLARFMAGAKEGWWTVFWIYNIVWGLGLLLLLIPIIPTGVLMFVFRGNEGAIVLSGCLGLLAIMFFGIVVTIAAAIWCTRAIVNWAIRRDDATEATGTASREIRLDLGRHLLAAIAIFVVGMAGSAFFATFSMFAGFGEIFGGGKNAFVVLMLPLRILGSVLNSALSAGLGTWLIAAYAAIAADSRVVQASGLPFGRPPAHGQAGGPHHT